MAAQKCDYAIIFSDAIVFLRQEKGIRLKVGCKDTFDCICILKHCKKNS